MQSWPASSYGSGTFYNDVMSANGAFIGTVTAGFSNLNWYTTGIVKFGTNHYFVAGLYNGQYAYVNGTSLYVHDGDMWEWSDTAGTPFDTVPANVMTYLENNDFTLTVE